MRDHIYVSPELAQYIRDVRVLPFEFPDHDVLQLICDIPVHPPKVPLWRMPKPLPWEDYTPCSDHQWKCAQDHPDDQIQEVFAEMERRFSDQFQSKGKTIPSAMLGRCVTREVEWVTEFSSPPVVGRAGEPQPGFHGINAQHAKWMKQLRRLHHVVQSTRAASQEQSSIHHRRELWKSVLNASGFPGGFRNFCFHHFHASIPEEEPSIASVEYIHDHFQNHVRELETTLKRERLQRAKKRRVDDPNVIFADLKQEGPQPVQMLLQTQVSQVCEVRAEDQSVVVDPPQSILQCQ